MENPYCDELTQVLQAEKIMCHISEYNTNKVIFLKLN